MEVFNFKSINQKLARQEQKAEFDKNNPPPVEIEPAMFGWPYGVATVPTPSDDADVYCLSAWTEIVWIGEIPPIID